MTDMLWMALGICIGVGVTSAFAAITFVFIGLMGRTK